MSDTWKRIKCVSCRANFTRAKDGICWNCKRSSKQKARHNKRQRRYNNLDPRPVPPPVAKAQEPTRREAVSGTVASQSRTDYPKTVPNEPVCAICGVKNGQPTTAVLVKPDMGEAVELSRADVLQKSFLALALWLGQQVKNNPDFVMCTTCLVSAFAASVTGTFQEDIQSYDLKRAIKKGKKH